MNDEELRARVAELLGYRAWKERRGDYTLCVVAAPGAREPWKGSRTPEPERFEPVSCADALGVGFFHGGFPEFERDIAAAWQVVRWASDPAIPDRLAEAFRRWWDQAALHTYDAPWAARAICQAVVRLCEEQGDER